MMALIALVCVGIGFDVFRCWLRWKLYRNTKEHEVTRFKVWDKNSEEKHGEYIDAFDAEDAAIQFAENAEDAAWVDLYTIDGEAMTDVETEGREVCVKTESGDLIVCRVGVVEFEPVYGAYVQKPPPEDGEE